MLVPSTVGSHNLLHDWPSNELFHFLCHFVFAGNDKHGSLRPSRGHVCGSQNARRSVSACGGSAILLFWGLYCDQSHSAVDQVRKDIMCSCFVRAVHFAL